MPHVSGPDFLALQVRDLDRAAAFYQHELGLARAPGVVAFQTAPIPFAVREPFPGTDLDAGPPGLGVSVSLRADDPQGLHDQLKGHGVPILIDPFDTPFGRTFVFQDPTATPSPSTAPHPGRKAANPASLLHVNGVSAPEVGITARPRYQIPHEGT
jgi:predicted enzyme related to lactoylglutathione lyase